MTVDAAAKELGCSPGLVYKLCTQGRLGFTRLGFGRGKIVIEKSDLEDYRKSVKSYPVPVGVEPKVLEHASSRRPAIRDYVGEYERRKKG